VERETRRIETLDWLRALAISMVLVHHIGRGMLKGFLPSSLGESWTGVDLFFVLSGYLVTRSFSEWLDGSASTANISNRSRIAMRYTFRRFLRILPPAWLWAAIPWAASVTFNQSGGFGDPTDLRREFFGVISFFYNYFTVETGLAKINYFWSLAVEEHFYMVLPFFLLGVRTPSRRLFGFVILVIVCGILKVAAVANGESLSAIRFLSHFRADALAIGGILGLLSREIIGDGFPRSAWFYSRGFSIVLAVLCASYLWFAPWFLTVSQIGSFGLLSFSVVSAVLVILALRFKPRSSGRLGTWVAGMGRRSYSLYLIHLPVYYAVREFRFRTLGMETHEAWANLSYALAELALCLLVLWAVNELNYRWLENPLIRRGRAWFARPNP
jgi:peptidoglycan/LPS O-acetylase OafA/YrhL